MATSLHQIEAVLARLKRAPGFSLKRRPHNREYEDWDVFPALAASRFDGFDPAIEGEAPNFVFWSKVAAAAFDKEGVLTRPFVLTWGGLWTDLQTAFAEAGLTVRLDREASPRDGYDASGTVVVSPRSDVIPSDLGRLVAAFRALEREGVVALCKPSFTQSGGWEDVNEKQKSPDQTATFWHDQGHESFDSHGNLGSSLCLYWRGDAEHIARVLRDHGLSVEVPGSKDVAIIVTRDPRAPVETIAPTLAPAAVARKRTSVKRKGPLEEIARRTFDVKCPVARVALAAGATSIAVAQSADRRGPPEHVLRLVDVASGATVHAFTSAMFSSCGGCAFLPDGRLVYAFYDFEEGANPVMALGVFDPVRGDEQSIRRERFSHVSAHGLMDLSQDGRLAAFASPRGAAILEVAPQGAPWGERRCVGGVPEAYPVVALHPDATAVVWTTDGSYDLRCLAVASGEDRWICYPYEGHLGGRGLRSMGFTAELLFVLVRTYARDRELRTLRVYNAISGDRVRPDLTDRTRDATNFALARGRGLIAVGDEAGNVRLLSLTDAKFEVSFPAFKKGAVSSLGFSADGRHLAAGSTKGEIAIYAIPDAR